MRRFFNTGLLLLLTISMGARSTNEEAKPALTNEPTKPVVQLVNIFADAGGAEAQYGDSPVTEQAINVLDNDATTKFLTFNASSWVQLKSYEYYTVSKYTLTSADDAPERDPKNWTLKGSMDGETWVVLDEQSNQSFSGRGQTKTYSFENKKEFRHYRMDMTNHSGEILQVADILLFGVKSEKVLPIAQFKVNRSKVLLGEVVQIENLSKNAAAFEWHFGDEKSSTEKAPEHQYAKGGVYDITLIASGNGVTDTEIIKDVFVMDTETCWSEFVYPHVKYSIKVDKNHEGIKLIEAATDNKVEEYMRAQTIVVADLIYKCPQEAPQFTEFIFEISEETPIAALGKVPGGIIIYMNPNHIVNINKQGGIDKVKYELQGVMTHELTHGYQNNPQGAGTYQKGDDHFGFIESLADYTRIVAGLHVDRKRIKGGHWNDGYTTGGFFIQWIEDTKKPAFAYLLNESCITMKPWSWEKACQEIVGCSVQELWNEYQQSIQ